MLILYCIISSCHRTASDANYWTIRALFIAMTTSCSEESALLLGVPSDPKFLWISLNSCPLNWLLVRNHQAEILIVKRLIQEHNNVTRVQVEPRSCDQGRRKTNALLSRPGCQLFFTKPDRFISDYRFSLSTLRTAS